jgi:hypothetical protein
MVSQQQVPGAGDMEHEPYVEYIAAGKRADRVIQHLGLSWEEVSQELDNFEDWRSPGTETVDLSNFENFR